MSQSLLEMATELTTALIQVGAIPSEQLQDTLQKTYSSLIELKGRGKYGATPPVAVDWRKSITRHTVTCLECGATYKQLSRHLAEHHLDSRSYRSKYGIPVSQPLAAQSVTAMRKTIAQQVRPWEKAPTFVKAKKGVKKTGRKRASKVKG